MPREERKVVTVLFADLVGFTARAETMDPEDVRALLAPYHSRLREELEHFGGTVEKFIGDAVMALFGAPVAHEDDPERAVRAALAIRDWVREENRFEVRIAVNTGEALVTVDARPDAGEGMASGDVVNTTARLQSAAPVNGILVGETTYRATRDRIEYDEREPVSAKGKAQPIPVWEAVRARSRVGVDLEERVVTPLVGRERELATLEGAFERARRECEPQLVTLVGVPGIGKSRLVAELYQRLDAAPELVWWRQGRSLPYGAGVAFWPLAEIVKAQMGIHENDSALEVEDKARASVAGTVADDEREWVLRHVEPLVGIQVDETPDRRESFAAWRRYLEGLAEQRPSVLVFEDLHWADDGVLDFVDYLAEWASGAPMLVIGTARPELIDRRPDWGGGKLNAVTLALSPLDETEAARVIAGVLEQTVLPAETQRALLERAGGNPLYAEQFARLYVERGSVEDVPLPENVQGIIAARVDALSPDEKRVLQDAAVLGKVFWSGALSSLSAQGGDEIAALMHSLERKGFVRRERRSAVEGETEFAFRHVLVREVAYAQVPRNARAQQHVAAVEWIKSLGRPDDQSELIAHHLVTAVGLLSASGGATDELVASAYAAFRRAGDRAASLNSFASAAGYYENALALAPADAPDRAVVLFGFARAQFLSKGGSADPLTAAADALLDAGNPLLAAEALAIAAEAAWDVADRESLGENLGRAMELIATLPPSRSKAWIVSQASRFAMLADRNDEAIKLADEALEMAAALDLQDVRVHALNNRGSARVTGRMDRGGFDDLETSVALGEEINSPDTPRSIHNLATMRYVDGDVRTAAELGRRAIAAAERFGVTPIWNFSRALQQLYEYRLGHWDEVSVAIDRFLAEQTGALYAESSTRLARAWIRLNRGDPSGALDDTASSLETARSAGDPQAVFPALTTRAFVLHACGVDDEAMEAADEWARRWEGPGGGRFFFGTPGEVVVGLLHILGAERLRNVLEPSAPRTTVWRDAAFALSKDDFARAWALYERSGDVVDAAVAELQWAKQLLETQRRAEADRHLRSALAFFRSVGATRYVREGEALLAAAS